MSQWADNIVRDIKSVRVCQELQEIEQEIQKVIAAQEAALMALVKNLESYLPLLTIPSVDPAAIVKFLKKLVLGTIEPYIESFESAMKKVEEVAADIAEITSAIESKISEIEGCASSISLSDLLPTSDQLSAAKTQLASAQSGISDLKTSIAADEESTTSSTTST